MDQSLSIEAFNGLLATFLDELIKVFPDEQGVEIFKDEFEMLRKVNPNAPVQLYMGALGPYSAMVMGKDPALFDQPIPLGKNIDLGKLWKSDLSDATRQALFDHVFTLFVVGMAVTSMPPDVLSSIEKAAKDVAAKVEAGQPLDFMSLLGGMSGLLSGGLGSPAADEKKKLM